MKKRPSPHTGRMLGCGLAGLLIAAAGTPVQAADETSYGEAVDALKRRVEEQARHIDSLKRALEDQERSLDALRSTVDTARLRGRGTTPPSKTTETAAPAPAAGASERPIVVAQAERPVGQAPEKSDERPPAVAPIFEQPGVLTPRGRWVVEPSLQYAYSANNRISLIGYTVIPAIHIGLIDIREVKSNSLVGALTLRRGITNRFELEMKIPYVYRWDDSLERPIGGGSTTAQAFDVDGRGLGDVELTARYQLNDGGADSAYYVGSLRVKSRTGRDPFESERAKFRLPGDGVDSSFYTELPTGSGFYVIQPGLTMLLPSDPAVFFGGISYQYSIRRDNIEQRYTDGTRDNIGDIQPGGAWGFNFGMGLALNERASFSIGYDHLSVGKAKINGNEQTTSVRTQLGTLLIGYSYRLSSTRTLNLSVGAGLTEDTPDLQLTLRVPFNL